MFLFMLSCTYLRQRPTIVEHSPTAYSTVDNFSNYTLCLILDLQTCVFYCILLTRGPSNSTIDVCQPETELHSDETVKSVFSPGMWI